MLKDAAQSDDTTFERSGIALGWQRVILVCGECEQRKDGPRHLTAKAAWRELKHALRHGPDKVRIVVTGCLGPCVKKALTVVAPAGDAPAGYAVCDEAQLLQAAARLQHR
jgi:hypothetical protein